ncbi:hypothetical protein ANDA3_2416 [plant metagenome]|uniref:Uncharacterized protein n=1 Tax=plant metagenome TaxID=1297885 RepID=A0A484UKN1_9ZZZZ
MGHVHLRAGQGEGRSGVRRAAGGLREGGAWRHGDTSSSGF